MNAIELLRKQMLEEDHARKQDAETKSGDIDSNIKSISREQISEYFDTVVIPAFEEIRNELVSFSFRIFIRKQVFTIQLTVHEADASTYFKIVLKNNKPMIIEMLYHYGSRFVHVHRTEVVFFRKEIDLSEYKGITGEKLLELFVRNFIARRDHPEKLRKEEEKKFFEDIGIKTQDL